ncbi:CYTH domain-containing protein [Shewanella surugensis]|uniref:CYTH domain-containing protein n=1 Tax=Shewanella surugensis TaxID=212020 RepID=A0ABT0LEQ3_9GAMM|nr:CYTH domain-containing protein [Shewanella surugensis]MCL1125815.1 CYTH domain-containing protein [Shewanella surugensis]
MMGDVKNQMAIEIELKLLFQENNKKNIINLFDNLNEAESKPLVFLKNQYFDTSDLQLRRWDMGLRIRAEDGRLEQTIKTAGTVVGGVHSRPEYNIDIQKNFPDLTLSPNTIWPNNTQVSHINDALQCLFSTDFSRQCWHVHVNHTVIEVALDLGSIYVGEFSETICELELELISGDPAELLTLAKRLAAKVPVRLGKSSKAKRGYLLAAEAGIIVQKQGAGSEVLLSVLEEKVDAFSHERDHEIKSKRAFDCVKIGLDCWLQWEDLQLNPSLSDPRALYCQFQQNLQLLQIVFSQAQCFSADNKAMFTHFIKEVDALKIGHISSSECINETNIKDEISALFNNPHYGLLQIILVKIALKAM